MSDLLTVIKILNFNIGKLDKLSLISYFFNCAIFLLQIQIQNTNILLFIIYIRALI